ncbi:MAG TPA: carboxypeptidase-like regulatory domain-containing protein [Terracidiphilus sp.]|nr:carboxypeptidase-like regulatory domain-containing protein [Terracidiphilus sp.]
MNRKLFGKLQTSSKAHDDSRAGFVKLQLPLFTSYPVTRIRVPVRCLRQIAALVCLILLGSVSTAAFAQVDISATLTGQVTDQNGAVIPNAVVHVVNVDTGVQANTTSNGIGTYQFVSLAAGTYTVSCAVKGFKSFAAIQVVLHAGGTTSLPVTLQVGATNETVTVSGSSAMVDTQTADNLITIDPDLIDAIPVEGRDPRESMEILMPGATAAGTGSSFFIPVTSFNGVTQLTNNYDVDGGAMNDYMHGSAASNFPQSENISEFSVESALPDASVGQGAGGQIEATMKNGTNQFHGQFWSYLQNGAWNANPWSNNFQGIPRQPFHQEWYGGNVGGPVWIPKLYNGKERTFFFFSYERTSTSKNSTTSGQTITEAERGGDFSNSPDGVPMINGVAMPTIPTSDFGPLGQLINSTAGKAILPVATSGTDTFTWNPSDVSLIQTWNIRIDENFSDKHRLFGSLFWYNDNPTFQDMYDEFSEESWATQYPNPDATWGEPVQTKDWAINDTYTISPSMLNNFILGITQSDIKVTNTWSSSNQLFDSSNTGIGSVGDTLAPSVEQITTPRNMGVDIWNGYINPAVLHTWNITDNFTFTKGRHTIKAGVLLRNFHEIFQQTYDSGGTVSFADYESIYGGTGNGIADMMLNGGPLSNNGAPAGNFGGTFYQNSTQNLDVNYPAREAYIQDTIKIKPRLTVMLGARLQPYLGVRPTNNAFVTFVPGQASTVFPTAPTGLVTIGDQGIPKNLTGDHYNVGPHASFAWDMFGNHKAALKGGYGLYTNYEVLLGFNGYTTTAPYGVDYYPSPGPDLSLANPYQQYGSNPFPYTPPTAGSPADATLVFPNPLSTVAIHPGYNSGQIHKVNLAFEIEPINTYVFTVAWVATRGTHLYESHNLNWPVFVPGGSTNDTANVYSRQPYYPSGFNEINEFFSDYNSMYNSLQIDVRKRVSHGLTLMGSYTFSSTSAQQGCRYLALCSIDYYSPGTVHQMTAAFSYQIPAFFKGNQWADRLFDGWGIGGTGTASTGSYGAVGDYNCDQYNFQSASCYANFTGGNPLLSNRKSVSMSGGSELGVTWLDPSKFIRAGNALESGVSTPLPGVGQRLFLGNATYGVWKGPASGIQDFNASLNKDFKIAENYKLSFHAEAFNALNHTVLNSPGYNNTVGPNTEGFGIISTANAPRNIQLSFHFIF